MVNKIALLLPIIVISTIIGILGLLFIPSEVKNKNLDFSKGTIKIDDKIMNVEIADSENERQRWLTFRNDRLGPNSGLLLIYDNPDLYSMWLLNIRYPLDLIWLDQFGNVVYIKENANPCDNILDASVCTFKNTMPAKFILATDSGFVSKNNITDSSRLELLSI
ncbi:MAG: DUF192 domain-containing protein [Thermoproteota archaeon]|nr:DUF192 domain-containing protein [Thermoproteota archaeon]